MPIKEIMDKMFSAYKYSLVAISLISIMLLSAATVQSQTIEEQQPASDPVSDYMNAIDNIEAEYSAYSTELSDLYLGLGKSLYSRQEYEKARQAFQRGMQIQRINYGLNSLSQGPYLLSIADAESFLGNWDESQEALENLYSINQQAYGANDVRMLPVLDQMLDWYLDSYDERTPKGGYANLIISERIATRMFSILEKELPLDDPEAPERFRRIGYLQYFIANHIKQHGEPSESGVTFSTGGSAARSEASTSRMHFQRGKLALEKVVAATAQQENSSPEDQAKAVAELGDWYLVFGQRFSAAQAYQLAYDVLETAEQPEQIRAELFDQPRIINFSMDKGSTSDPAPEQMEVRMTVSAYGVPQGVEVDEDTDISKAQIKALRRNVSSMRFRPKLQNGVAEAAPYKSLYAVPAPKS